MRLSYGINRVAKKLCSPIASSSVDFSSDAAKLDVMIHTAKEGNLRASNRGDVTSFSSMFSISRSYADRILRCFRE